MSAAVSLGVYSGVTLAFWGMALGVTFALLDACGQYSPSEVLGAMLGSAPNESVLESFVQFDGRVYVVVALGMGAIAGFWLTLCLPHHRRRWVPWVVHAGVLTGLTCVFVATTVVSALLRRGDVGLRDIHMALDQDIWRFITQGWKVMPLVAFAGTPVGWLLGRGVWALARNAPVRRFAKLRTRIRKARFRS